MSLTAAQEREWRNLTSGKSADAGILQAAGLVDLGVELRLVGRKLTRVEVVSLTDAGRAALSKAT